MEVAEAKTLIKSLVGDLIAPATLVDVNVSEDSDMDGDPILNVRAVYDASRPSPKADKMLTASLAVRLNLRLAGEQRFPLVAFVSSDDENGVAA